MNLRSYLDEHDVSISHFSGQIEVSVAAMHRYLTGERIPRPEVLERISLVTNGAVKPNDFYAFSQDKEQPAPEAVA
jgi:glutamine synthetase